MAKVNRDPEESIGDLEAASVSMFVTVCFCLLFLALILFLIMGDWLMDLFRPTPPPAAYEIPDAEYARGATTEDQTL